MEEQKQINEENIWFSMCKGYIEHSRIVCEPP